MAIPFTTITFSYAPPSGAVATGTVTATLTTPILDLTDKIVVPAGVYTGIVNAAGQGSLQVPQSDYAGFSTVPSYLFTQNVAGAGVPFWAPIPSTLGPIVDITQIAPSAPPPIPSAFGTPNTWTALQTFMAGLRFPTGAATGKVLGSSDSSGDAAWVSALLAANNLSDLASPASARANLGLALTPAFTAKSGAYIQGQLSVTTATLSNTLLRLCVFPVTQPITIAQMGIEFTAAGDAGSFYHPAIYADDGSGFPGALVLDAPTISTGTGNAGTVATNGVPGVYLGTPGSPPTLQPGLYWVGGALQSAPVTQPTFRTAAFASQFPGGNNALPGTGAFSGGFSQASVSGAMPANFNLFSVAGVVATFARIIFKLA